MHTPSPARISKRLRDRDAIACVRIHECAGGSNGALVGGSFGELHKLTPFPSERGHKKGHSHFGAIHAAETSRLPHHAADSHDVLHVFGEHFIDERLVWGHYGLAILRR